MAGREAGPWLREKTLTVEHAGEPLSRYAAEFSAGTGKPRAIARPDAVFAFAVCFFVLLSVWYGHYKFFRRSGLRDAPTVWLNSALLFLVLFFVYPLKFLFTLVVGQLLGFGGAQKMVEPSQGPL